MNIEFGNIADLIADEDAERNGIEYDLGRGRVIICRRAGGANRLYEAAVSSVLARKREENGWGSGYKLTEDESREVLEEAFCETVFVNWRGFKDTSENEIPYSPEAALQFIRLAREEFVKIKRFCEAMVSFQNKVTAEDKEAFLRLSPGKRTGANVKKTSELPSRRAS